MDLSKLCNVVKYDVVKKPAYDDKTNVMQVRLLLLTKLMQVRLLILVI